MFDKLDLPKLDAITVIKEIKNSYQKQTKISRMLTLSYENKIQEYEEEYFNNKRYNLIPIKIIDEMDKKNSNYLYENKIVNARIGNLYDNITREQGGFCPVCGANGDTLDHVLPKKHFVQYTLTPINMVPMCGRCNRKKKDLYSNESDKEIFHPYFDDYSELTGLCAEYVIKNNDFVPIFYLDKTVAEKKWIYNFNDVFKLNNVLSAVSTQKISNILNILRKTKGEPNHKIKCIKLLEYDKNSPFISSWEKLLYDLILCNFDDFYRVV